MDIVLDDATGDISAAEETVDMASKSASVASPSDFGSVGAAVKVSQGAVSSAASAANAAEEAASAAASAAADFTSEAEAAAIAAMEALETGNLEAAIEIA